MLTPQLFEGVFESALPEPGDWVELMAVNCRQPIHFILDGYGVAELPDGTYVKFNGLLENGNPSVSYKNYTGEATNTYLEVLPKDMPHNVILRRANRISQLGFEKLFEFQKKTNYKPGNLYRINFYNPFKMFGKGLDKKIVLLVEMVLKNEVLSCRFVCGEKVVEAALMSTRDGGPIFELTKVKGE